MARNAKRKTQFSIVYLIIGLLVLMIIQFWFISPRSHEITYTKFLQLVREDKVEKVQLGEKEIRGVLKEGVPLTEVLDKETQRFIRPDEKAKEKVYFVATRLPGVDERDLIKELESKGVEITGVVQNNFFKDIFLIWVLPILVMVALWGFFMRRFAEGGAGTALTFGKSRAKIYDKKELKITFEDVAGVDEAEAELQEVVDFLRNPKKYQRLGGRIPKGVLLIGSPGTGKTLLARAVAGEADVPFFAISASEFVEMFVGVGAARVRDLFEKAKEKAPCIIFIDELDAIGKSRGGIGIVGGHDEREQTLNQLLAEMDGFDTSKGVIIMAATNRPEVLDTALLRPGRFDRQVVVDKPDLKGREEILKVHAKNVKLDPSVELKVIAARTPGFAGAELANIINEAALLAARKGKDTVEMPDLEEAIDRLIAGLEKKSRVLSEKERDIVAHHEIGHALVAMSVEHADPVHKVSIIPRGVAALGMTLQLPTEDRYILTKPELLDRIAVLLGGRVAEEIIYGVLSTGAQNDLEQATEIVRRMVCDYGMSERLGPLTFGEPVESIFLRKGLGYTREVNYSEETARAIDEEARSIINETYKRVSGILEKKKDLLQRLAEELKKRETLDGEALRSLIEKEGKKEKLSVIN